MRQIISYIRLSTGKQGRSGLGIEAQREAIARFAAAEGREVLAEFVEVETGKGADALDRRPKLAEAAELYGGVVIKLGDEVIGSIGAAIAKWLEDPVKRAAPVFKSIDCVYAGSPMAVRRTHGSYAVASCSAAPYLRYLST
jgi:Resolvase, N terminal domain